MAVVLHAQGGKIGTSTCSVPVHVENVPERFMLFFGAVNDRTKSISTAPVWHPSGTVGAGDQALTLLASYSSVGGSSLHYEVWYLLNPNSSTDLSSLVGTYTWGGTISSIQAVTVWSGVHQTTPWTGYPSLPTIVSQQGTSAPTTWPTLSVTTAAGDYVVDCAASAVGTASPVINPAAGQVEYQNRYGEQASGNPRIMQSTKTAVGASTTVGWTATTAGLTFLEMAFALKPSASTAPYWAEPPSTKITTAASPGAASITVVDTTNFPASGQLWIGELVDYSAPFLATYTSKTATTFTLSPTLSTQTRNGDRVLQLTGATTVGTSIDIVMPLHAVANDILVVAIFSAATGGLTIPVTHPGPADDFTQINAQVGTGFRFDTYWRRITAADVATPPTFTFTAAASVQRTASFALYRGATTSGSPIGTGTASPTTNSGASGAGTALGLTTTVANMAAVAAYAINGTGTLNWIPQNINLMEHVDLNTTALYEATVLTASAVANQPLLCSDQGDPWLAQMFTLIPTGVAGVVWNRALTRTGSVLETPSRATSTYHRSATRTGTVAEVLKRAASIYHKALLRTGTVAEVLARSLTGHRALFRTGTVAEAVSKAGSTYHKTATRVGSISEIVQRVINSANIITRNLLRTGTISEVVSRSGSTYHKTVTRTGTVVELTSRGLSTYHRSSTRTGTVTEAVKKSGSTYHKALLRTGSVLELVARTIQSAGQSFFAFGSFPILRLWEAAEFVTPTIFFEADLVASNANPAFARLFDVTAGAAVVGSQITTTAPHTTQQRVRSGAIALVSGHVYRAEVGRNAGYTASIASADIIVQVP